MLPLSVSKVKQNVLHDHLMYVANCEIAYWSEKHQMLHIGGLFEPSSCPTKFVTCKYHNHGD